MSADVLDVWGDPIDLETPLWRYMNVDRLVSLLRQSTIYFAAATQFSDKFEGAVAVQHPSTRSDPRYSELSSADYAFRELKRLTKISCWHLETYESDAMWRLYSGESKGVAIRSTPGRILESVTPFRLQPNFGTESLHLGPVRYKDLAQVRLKPSMLQRFFYKHRAFYWEREYRLAISLRMAEECGVTVPEEGIDVTFSLDKLINGIVLGPFVTDEDQERINVLCDEMDLQFEIIESSLTWLPRYV